MRLNKKLFLITVPIVSSIALYKWETWKTGLLKALIKREKNKGSITKFAKRYPDPPKSLLRKYPFDKIDINGALGYWINKEKAPNGVLVYLHGGGYVFGPIEVQWKYIANMSRAADMAAIVVDYKMAPDFPYPKGLHDVENIISTLQAEGALPENYYLLGDSAGGGMAVSVTNRLIDKKAPLPRKLILMSPWLDLSMSNPAIKLTADEEIMLPLEEVKRSASKYAQQNNLKDPMISPIYGNVKGLPPVLIQIGTAELFLWDNRKFVQKLTEANVEVKYEEYNEMFHVFALVHILKEGKKAMKSQLDFIRA
ncbi:alpha/beta hydrolase [Pontibacter diazotrophicus]|uniref:Alpha/beta hydrolase n=1 Tax=Pontibacter diazotrophicus TaxID=1400979 RepID=A0A3D8LAI9_9BACT|nr:alpha/beta hydrolase [Pontibacter diazotrophicus]RDV14400.1 alpha/beta hydrolase [Pontibacter diazotrophicus]